MTGKDGGQVTIANQKVDAEWVWNRLMAPLNVEIEDMPDDRHRMDC
jgi:hypothetical protein